MEADHPPVQQDCLMLISKIFLTSKSRIKLKEASVLNHHQVHLRTYLLLCIDHNEYPHIIKDIIHIKFPKMTFLQLSYNNIRSIEALKFLDAPQLKTLHLSFNDIKEAKTLRKCDFPFLEKLVLMKTYISQLQFLAECNFPKMNHLVLQRKKPGTAEGGQIYHNLALLAKLYITTQMKLDTLRQKQFPPLRFLVAHKFKGVK